MLVPSREPPPAASLTLYTVGHSNHPLDAFLTLIGAHQVRVIADVRAFPTSRRWPHFNREALAATLEQRGIRYQWIPALGGRRRGGPRGDSPHTAWTVDAFRHYADHMASEEFATGIAQLVALAHHGTTAFMCAEALYWLPSPADCGLPGCEWLRCDAHRQCNARRSAQAP